MFKPPTDSFTVKPLTWGNSWPVADLPKAEWQTNSELKKLFGIELGKGTEPFKAGLVIFGDDANKALWASHYWRTDPIVIAARDLYAEAVETKSNLLDKDALSVKLLEFADEKHPSGQFYINEAKDRLAALKLYAEVQGFVGKIDINASTNTFVNNKLELVLVKVDKKIEPKPTIIENENQEIINNLPADIKLVSASR